MQRQIALALALVVALNGQVSNRVSSGHCASSFLVYLNVAVTDQAGTVISDLKRTDFAITEDGKKQGIAVFAFQGSVLDTTPVTAPHRFGEINHRLITFLFDITMMSLNERARIADDAIDFIRNDLKPGELLSIETGNANSVTTTQDFTDDRTALLAAVNKSRTGGIAGDNPSEFEMFNASASLAKLTTVCRRLPGATRKTLLYFASAIERTAEENRAALESAVNECTRANVAIDPIGPASASVAELAAKTSGQTFADRWPAIEKARRESEGYYVIGYYASNDRRDGSYRNVEVKLARADLQQARLDYSRGYFMDIDFPKFTPAGEEDFLKKALGPGEPVTDLPIAVEVDYFRIAPNLYRVPITVKLPGSAIALEKHWNFKSAHLDFHDQIISGTQSVTWTLQDSIDIPLEQATIDELSSSPVIRTTQTLLPAGANNLNLVVIENEIGLAGTYRGSLDIPNLDAETGKVPISSMVLGTESQPIPNVTHVFQKNQIVHVYAEAYDALTIDEGKPNVTATVTVLRENEIVFASKPLTFDHFAPERDRTLPITLEIPLKELPAGAYKVRLSVIDNNAHKLGEREADIRIQPDGQPEPPPIPQPPPIREFSRVLCF